MIKADIISFIDALARRLEALEGTDELEPLAVKVLHDEMLLLDYLQSFTRDSRVFQATEEGGNVDFSAFVDRFGTSLCQLSCEADEQATVADFIMRCIQESTQQTTTFMGVELNEVALKGLVYLDGQYFDITDILTFIISKQGENAGIWQNPASVTVKDFSASAQAFLRKHPVTRKCIADYELLQKQRAERAQKTVPDKFYDDLIFYLKELDEIGKRSEPWSFPEDKKGIIDACQAAKAKFIDQLTAAYSESQCEAIWELPVRAKLIRGPALNATFVDVFHGKNYFDCIKVQQVCQWYLVKSKRPQQEIPADVLNCDEGRRIDFSGQAAAPESEPPGRSAQGEFFVVAGFFALPRTVISGPNGQEIPVIFFPTDGGPTPASEEMVREAMRHLNVRR